MDLEKRQQQRQQKLLLLHPLAAPLKLRLQLCLFLPLPQYLPRLLNTQRLQSKP